jgi:hypothetical protein
LTSMPRGKRSGGNQPENSHVTETAPYIGS